MDSAIQVGVSCVDAKDSLRKPRTFTCDKIADSISSDSEEYNDKYLGLCNDVSEYVDNIDLKISGYLLKCIRAGLKDIEYDPNSKTQSIGTQCDPEDLLEAWDDYYEMKIDEFKNCKAEY